MVGAVFLRLNFCGLLSLVAVIYFEMGQNWDIFILGNKKELKLSHKPLI